MIKQRLMGYATQQLYVVTTDGSTQDLIRYIPRDNTVAMMIVDGMLRNAADPADHLVWSFRSRITKKNGVIMSCDAFNYSGFPDYDGHLGTMNFRPDGDGFIAFVTGAAGFTISWQLDLTSCVL